MYFLLTRKVNRFLGIIRLRPLNAAYHCESKEVGNRTSWSPVTHARFWECSACIHLPSSKSNPVCSGRPETQRWRQGAPCIVGSLSQGCKLMRCDRWYHISQYISGLLCYLQNSQLWVTWNMNHTQESIRAREKGAYRRYKEYVVEISNVQAIFWLEYLVKPTVEAIFILSDWKIFFFTVKSSFSPLNVNWWTLLAVRTSIAST